MKQSHRRRVQLGVAIAAGLSSTIMFDVKLVRAQQNPNDQTVFFNANDSAGASSFAGGGPFQWQASTGIYSTAPYTNGAILPAGTAPAAGYAFVVTGSSAGTGLLRTPTSGTSSFAGDSLTIIPYNGQANLYTNSTSIVNPVDTSAALVIGGNVAGQNITVSNLVLANGGAVIDSGNSPSVSMSTTLSGNITLLPAGTVLDGVSTTMSGGIIDGTAEPSSGTVNVPNLFVINATLNGSGLLHVISSGGTGASTVALNSSNPAFTGGVLLDNTIQGGSGNQPYLLINSPTALGTGTFTIGSQTLGTGVNQSSSSGPTIDNASGAAETLTTNNPLVWNGNFQYEGNNPQTTAPDSLNLGSGGVTLGASIQVGVYGRGVLSETGNISSGGYTTSTPALTLTYGGIFEVPSPANLSTIRTNVSSGTTLAFLAANTSSAQFITALTNSTNYALNFSSGTSLGIDTAGYSGTFVFSGTLPITAIGLNKLGTGTLQLGTANAYTGPTNVSAGTLQLANATSIASTSGVLILSGATLDVNGYTPATIAYLNGSGNVTNNGTSSATLNISTGASSASSSATAIFGGSIGNGASALGLTVNLTTATYNFNISNATDTYTGGTLLKSGLLIVGANSIPSGGSVAFNGGVLDFAAQPANTFSMNVGTGSSYNFSAGSGVTVFLPGNLSNSTSAASVNMSGAGVVIIGGTNTYTGATNIGTGTFGFASPASFTAAISANGYTVTNAAASFGIGNITGNNFALTVPISGAGGLNKVGTNTVTLPSAINTYTGTTNISGGTLLLGNAGAIPASSNVSIASAGTLDLGGYSISIKNLLGSGLVTNSIATPVSLTIATGSPTLTTGWAGNIANGAGTTSLIVSPSNGIFNMSGSVNSYTGGTNLVSGTLVVGAASLPAIGSVLFNGGSLDFTAPLTIDPSVNFMAIGSNNYNFNDSNGTTVTLNGGLGNAVNNSTGVTMTGTGAVLLGGVNTFTGPITITSGTLGFTSPSAYPPGIVSSGIALGGTGYFGVGNSTSNYALTIAVSGTGGLNKFGTDTVTVTGNNSYTGVTLISNGTLALGSATALGNTSTVNLGSNSAAPDGTLDLNSYSITINSPNGGAYGGVITNSNSSAAVLTLQPSTTNGSYFGSITGNLLVVINFPNPTSSSGSSTPAENFGTGTVPNAMTYTGTTSLAGGVLSLGGPGLLPTASRNIQFNGGYLQLSGNNQTTASAMDYSAGFSVAPNQLYNIIAGGNAYTYTFNSGLNSPGGSLQLGNYNYGGAGTLVLAAANTYSGSTNVNTGVLTVANPRALVGTSGISVNSYTASALGSLTQEGTLQISDTSGQAGLNALGQPTTVTLNGLGIYGNVTYTHFVAGRATNTLVGYSYTGALQGTAPNGSAGTIAQPDVWAGNIVIGNAYSINGTSYIGISGGFSNVSTGTNTVGASGALMITGAISGTGNVVLGLNSFSDTILAGANTYVGETQITAIANAATTVQLGANNSVPAASGLDFANDNAVQASNEGNSSTPQFNYSSATFDLNGYNTSTAYVTSSTSLINIVSSVTTLNTNGVVTNTKNGSTSTLTILSQAANPYQGIYQDGSATAKLALNFNGGTQVFTGTNNYSGGTTITSGLLVVGSMAAVGSGNITVNANAILQNTSAGTVFALLHSGYNGGNWNGSGINSTYAANDSTHLTAVGMLQPSSPITFEGTTLNPADVALKLTYYGDANLDGKVDGSDYSIIDYSFINNSNSSNTALTGWQNGDFNYDGVIDGSDYALIDNSFNTQGAQFSVEVASPTAQIAGASSGASVPEPTSLGLISIAAFGLLGRRRRQ